MKPDRYQALKEMFLAARDLPGEKRTEYLKRVCAADAALRKEVERLLAADEAGQPFPEPFVPAPSHPDRIGRYTIRGILDEGGMGTVYEAEQDQPQRTVALKVIRPGLASGSRLRRFEHEAELLGRLQHPGIAQILEAGTADTGHGLQPFFAMELVKGRLITEYAERAKLSTRARLDLLARTCDAVEHAHQRGIIHRDLKPANILVDDTGQPKILDFGIARTTDSDIRATTLRTDVGQLIGTVPYMSPEQVTGDPTRLDTRSDVYSLGVVAYELLAGRLPYNLEEKTIPEAVRIIQDDEPTPLSTVNKVFRGDLDTIVAKALEKNKERRYQSASALATDMRRYLRSEPILARPASATYQLRKLVARHRAPFAFAALLFLAVAVFAVVATVQAVRIGDERDKALAAQAQELAAREAAEQVSEFLEGLFEVSDPAEAQGREIMAREILDDGVERIRQELEDQPLVQARLMDTMGTVYHGLVIPDRARELLETALAIRRRELGDNHLDVAESLIHLARVVAGQSADARELMQREALAIRQRHLDSDHELIAEALNDLGTARFHQGDNAGAIDLFRQALEMRRRIHGEVHAEIAETLHNLSVVYQVLRDFEEAEALSRESLAIYRDLLGDLHPHVANNLDSLAQIVFARGDPAESEALIRESLEVKRKLYESEHPQVAHALHNLAFLVSQRGDHKEAESLYREALAIRRNLFGNDDPGVADTLRDLGALLMSRGDYAAAEPLLREAVAVCRAALGDEHAKVASCLNNLAVLLLRRGKYSEAEPPLRETVRTWRKTLGAEHPGVATALNTLGLVLNAQGKFGEAESALREALELRRKVRGDTHPQVAESLNGLANALREKGDFAEAEALYRQALEIWREALGQEHQHVAMAISNIATVLRDTGEYEAAEPLHREALAMQRRLLGSEHQDLAFTLAELGQLLLQEDDPAAAEALFRESLEMRRKLLDQKHPDVAWSLCYLAQAHVRQGATDDAEAICRESLAIFRNVLGPDHPAIAATSTTLAHVLVESGDPSTAEPLLRAALDLMYRRLPDGHPSAANTQSILGACLTALGRYEQAEPLLLESYHTLTATRTERHRHTHDALERIIGLYEAWNDPKQAAEWRAKLPTT